MKLNIMTKAKQMALVKRVLQLKNKVRIEQFHAPNQYLIYCENNAVIFQSYNSICAVLIDGELFIFEKYINFTKTTSKYLYKFIREKAEINITELNELYLLIQKGQIAIL